MTDTDQERWENAHLERVALSEDGTRQPRVKGEARVFELHDMIQIGRERRMVSEWLRARTVELERIEHARVNARDGTVERRITWQVTCGPFVWRLSREAFERALLERRGVLGPVDGWFC